MKDHDQFTKVTKEDGIWLAELYPVEGNAFAKWGVKQFKDSPIGWIETGRPELYSNRKVAINGLLHQGYTRLG